MSNNLKLVFVPVWLENVLKASNVGLDTVLDPEKLSRIISRGDLDLYLNIQNSLGSFLPLSVVYSFGSGDERQCYAELPVEEKRGYLYGFTLNNSDLAASPVLTAHHVGYDYVMLTVATDQTTQDKDYVILMGEILGILRSVLPLEEVAKLPIMETWLKHGEKNSIL